MPMFDNQATIFRFLVVASLVIAILGASVDYFVPGLVPPVLDEAYQAYAEGEEPTLSYALAMGAGALVLFIGGIVVTIGLLLFKSWSRPLCLGLSVVSLGFYPFLGAAVLSGWSTMLTELSMTLWGAAVAMAYFADIKVRFARASS